jgi:hypothetical protein
MTLNLAFRRFDGVHGQKGVRLSFGAAGGKKKKRLSNAAGSYVSMMVVLDWMALWAFALIRCRFSRVLM